QRRFIDIARQDPPRSALLYEYDGVVLLSAIAAEERGIEPRVRIVWVEKLAVEGNQPMGRCAKRRIDAAGAREETMQLERHESAIAVATTFVRWPVHKNQHGLKLRSTARFVSPRLLRKALGSVLDRGWDTTRQPLPIFKANF